MLTRGAEQVQNQARIQGDPAKVHRYRRRGLVRHMREVIYPGARGGIITASVVSGVISETDPTKVVLPTPKPPATTIFTEVIATSPASPRRGDLELAKSTEHPFPSRFRSEATLRVIQLMDPDQSFHRHVGDEHPGHAQRHPEHGRYFGYGAPVPAKAQDRLALRAEDR